MAAMSDYLENKLIDQVFRLQTAPTISALYVALLTAAPTDSGGGTEVSGGSYARVNLAPSLANWAGTQSAGSTTASTPRTGVSSNNSAITFAAPTANWGVITSWGIYDASTAGNLLWYGNLSVSKTVNNGDAAPSFGIGQLSIQIDN
jgi:hypothetical protein